MSSTPVVQPDPNQQQMPNPLVEDQTKPLGSRNENLSKSLQLVIWDLLMRQERQDEIPRRNEICEILKRKLYYRDEQYWWYSTDLGQWFPPTQAPEGSGEDYQAPAFQHVTNIIRPFAESLQAVLGQNNTQAKFFPKRASDPQSVATAQQATKAVDMIHRKNDWQSRIDEATYYMCTDGFLGGYVRHETDAEKYGSESMDVYSAQEVPSGDPMVQCQSCGYQDYGTTEQTPVCPECGAANSDYQPTATVPNYEGSISIPNGQEVITIVPALNLKRTMWADRQCDFLYLEWIYDLHRAKAMSMYPHAADLIESSAATYGDGGTANSYERIARRLLYLGTGRFTGMVLEDLGVIRHAWIRPCALEVIKDDVSKQQLQALFPKGICVTFYNDVYCESHSECMDEYWETMQTCDGEGQVRPTLISSILPVQDQLNDSINLLFEQNMNGVPEAFGDQNTIDFEARSEQTASPGNMTPVDLTPGQDIREKVFFSPAVEPAEALVSYIQQLFSEIPQFITGVFPALFGGNTGANDTASGIAIQRNQALGRIGKAWRKLQLFCSNLDGKAVNCFQKNMTQDVEIPKENETGGYESDWIRLEDMQGQVIAYPEVDAQYPTLQSDIRGLIVSLLNEANPLFMAVAQQPENMDYIFDEIGLTDIEVPGEQQRKKTQADIEQLLQEQPQQVPAQEPQMPGAPPQQPTLVPSVQPDPLIDNLQVAAETVKHFLISDEGMEAKKANPPGYANVYAYAKAIDQLSKQQAFQQAVVTQAMAGQGPAADLGGSEHIQSPQSPNPDGPQPSEGPEKS